MDKLKKYKSLEYVHDIDWKDVFSVWRAYESYQKSWRYHWEERNFKSWDDWRLNYIAPIFPENKSWKIFRINGFKEVMDFYGVPARGWIAKCYDGEITKKLGDILEHPVVKENDKVEKIINNFPYQTMLTGIVKDGNIVVIEGMHRALALALMSRKEMEINSDVVIALAEHEGEIPIIGKGDLKK